MKTMCHILLLLLLIPALWSPVAVADDSPLEVVVSILPQAWFVEEIGGPQANVWVMVGPGHSPATFEPTPRHLARLQDADVFFSVGVPFERGLLPRIESMKKAPPVVGPRPEHLEIEAGHDHHHHHHHHEDGLDPHTWLSPSLAREMAREMAAELSRLAPQHGPLFQERLVRLEKQLLDLEQEIAVLLTDVAGAKFFVFHPAFGHFAEAFSLVQIAVEDQGHEPGPKQLAKVIDQAKTSGARAIIVQPQFSKKSAQTLADAAQLEVVPLDPLARNYPENLRHIALTLARLLKPTQEHKP